MISADWLPYITTASNTKNTFWGEVIMTSREGIFLPLFFFFKGGKKRKNSWQLLHEKMTSRSLMTPSQETCVVAMKNLKTLWNDHENLLWVLECLNCHFPTVVVKTMWNVHMKFGSPRMFDTAFYAESYIWKTKIAYNCGSFLMVGKIFTLLGYSICSGCTT